MYQKILIATDGSKFANAAVDHGVQLASKIGASVVIVTVTRAWSAFQMAENLEKGISSPIDAYEASVQQEASDILEAAKATADLAGVSSQTVHVKNSFPAEGIIKCADENNCDLIVMASHGRRGIDRMLLGSQAAEVLSFSKTPVLILR